MVARSSKHFFLQQYHLFAVEPQQLTSAASKETTNDVIIFFFHWMMSEWPFLSLSPLLDKVPQNAITEVQR